jgi:predicted RNA-binding protein YlqC (UPF0109 family)
LIKLIDYIAKKLSLHPKDVNIEEKAAPDGVEYTLTLNPKDLPELIGRQGRTIRAIRALMAISSIRSGKRSTLKLDSALEPLPEEGEKFDDQSSD